MRPYLVFSAVILMAAMAFGQQPFTRPGLCFYGCSPYVPMLTTPEISLQSVSPNPVGASNATTGLIAGATNSTLSQIQGSTSSEYPVAVWYRGGAPLMTPEVRIWPETIGQEPHIMHGGMMHEMHAGTMHDMHEMQMEEHEGEEHAQHAERRAGNWTYFTGRLAASTESTPSVKPGKKATHAYTNDDVNRQNEKNGNVKYDGKTEKI